MYCNFKLFKKKVSEKFFVTKNFSNNLVKMSSRLKNVNFFERRIKEGFIFNSQSEQLSCWAVLMHTIP